VRDSYEHENAQEEGFGCAFHKLGWFTQIYPCINYMLRFDYVIVEKTTMNKNLIWGTGYLLQVIGI
jgi:hypothetical protein